MSDRIKLTTTRVRNLPVRPDRYKVLDAEISGFSVRVYPSGKKAFFYRYRVGGGGTIKEPKIGDFGPTTVDQARSIALDWSAQVRLGGDPMADRLALRTRPKMADLFDRYLEDHASRRKKTASYLADLRMIENHLRKPFGALSVDEVTRQKVRALHQSLEETPYLANRMLALLSKVFSFAADELEWIGRGDHPVKGIKRFPEKKRKRYLSQQELARLGDTLVMAERGELGRSVSPYAVAMIRLLALTGARHSEIRKLRWDEVNFERRCLELSDSKTGEKEVFLPPAALEVLAGLKRQDGNPFVIVGKRPGTHLINVKDTWAFVCNQAGLDDARMHDLRHSFASVGARAGMSLPVIGALLGHRETATTARYAHLSDDPKRLAADAIGEEIAKAMGARLGG